MMGAVGVASVRISVDARHPAQADLLNAGPGRIVDAVDVEEIARDPDAVAAREERAY